ncbi:hypothetical protein BgiMline_029742, partial [Biomphalaria glabrata]
VIHVTGLKGKKLLTNDANRRDSRQTTGIGLLLEIVLFHTRHTDVRRLSHIADLMTVISGSEGSFRCTDLDG